MRRKETNGRHGIKGNGILDPAPIVAEFDDLLVNSRRSIFRVRNKVDLPDVEQSVLEGLQAAQLRSQNAVRRHLVAVGYGGVATSLISALISGGVEQLEIYSNVVPREAIDAVERFWNASNDQVVRRYLSFSAELHPAKMQRAIRTSSSRGRRPRTGRKRSQRWLIVAGLIWGLLKAGSIKPQDAARVLDFAGFQFDNIYPESAAAKLSRSVFEKIDIGDRERGPIKSFRDCVRLEDSIKKLKRRQAIPKSLPVDTPWRFIRKKLSQAQRDAQKKGVLSVVRNVREFVETFPEFKSALHAPVTNRK